jgi:hypothetical protein
MRFHDISKAHFCIKFLDPIIYDVSVTAHSEDHMFFILYSDGKKLAGGWRKLHNEELHNLYSSPSIIRMIKSRRIRWAGHVARMEERRKACRILVGKPKGRRPLGRQRRRWVHNIKMGFREIGWDGIDWIDLAQDRDQWRALVNTAMNLRVH